jgi:hypothetical protein
MLAGSLVYGASLCLASLAQPVTSPPASDPAGTPSAEPAAPESGDPTDSDIGANPFEPAAEPAPEPAPSASGSASAEIGTEPIESPTPAATESTDPPDTSPVVRAQDGNWGMQFTFGGLAPLSIAGVPDRGVNRLLFSELGFRRMFKNGWALPFSIGAGVFHHEPDGASAQNDVGLAGSVGIRKYFRIWRRIAPYVGGDLRLHYLDPTGDNNWMVGIGLGPVLGIEYFVGDRVSLLFQGEAVLGIAVFDGLTQVRAATQVAAGGQLGLLFYF